MYFFLFKQKTAYEMRISDWSSDVCSSDLHLQGSYARMLALPGRRPLPLQAEDIGPKGEESGLADERRRRIVAGHAQPDRLARPRRRPVGRRPVPCQEIGRAHV